MKYSRTKQYTAVHVSAEEFAKFTKQADGSYILQLPIVDFSASDDLIGKIEEDVAASVPKNTIIKKHGLTDAQLSNIFRSRYGDHRITEVKTKIIQAKAKAN